MADGPILHEDEDNGSAYRRAGGALITLGFLFTITVSIVWAAADLSWRIWVPTALIDLFLFVSVLALALADIRHGGAE